MINQPENAKHCDSTAKVVKIHQTWQYLVSPQTASNEQNTFLLIHFRISHLFLQIKSACSSNGRVRMNVK